MACNFDEQHLRAQSVRSCCSFDLLGCEHHDHSINWVQSLVRAIYRRFLLDLLTLLLSRRHRRDIRANLSNEGTTSAAQSILTLLCESGFLYCIIWVSHVFVARLGVSGVITYDEPGILHRQYSTTRPREYPKPIPNLWRRCTATRGMSCLTLRFETCARTLSRLRNTGSSTLR